MGRTSGGTYALLGGAKPFGEHKHQVSAGFLAVQIFGNIAMFIPLGVLLPYLLNVTKFKSVFLMSLAFSAGIEITQYITGRGLCEFDDVFNNTLGACVGFTSWRLKMRYNKKYKNEQSPW